MALAHPGGGAALQALEAVGLWGSVDFGARPDPRRMGKPSAAWEVSRHPAHLCRGGRRSGPVYSWFTQSPKRSGVSVCGGLEVLVDTVCVCWVGAGRGEQGSEKQ